MRVFPPFLCAVSLLTASAAARPQAGDVAGEAQPALPAHVRAPAAPAQAAEEEWATFRLPAGLAIELVAAEPLVRDPVSARFDERGRLWVVEMSGYMPDADGAGELEPVGTIAVLSDADGDGRMDRRAEFLSELVLPRSLEFVGDGVLVIAPPQLLFCRDTDGDGRADERRVVASGLPGLDNPEHAVNGLTIGLDNWIEAANWSRRYRLVDGEWRERATAGGGQWGLARDDRGRLWFNTNSHALRMDRVPSFYLARNRHHGFASGGNVLVVGAAPAFPARVTPGVNRAYRDGTLRADGRLAVVTAACAPWILRGGGLGDAFRGDAFVCEPAGNLVQRFRLRDEGAAVVAEQLASGASTAGLAEPVAGQELDFLTSTDERFRPVALSGGPDGALYVVDMYRGVIQHRVFMTSFLRAQVEARGLEAPIGLGRIWRIRAADVQPAPELPFADASWTELARLLDHPDGWWRDTAQRLFVAEGADDPDASAVLRELLAGGATSLGRLHAFWTLEGLGALRRDDVLAALADEDERVSTDALRLAESWLRRADEDVIARVAERGRVGGPLARHQALLSLGEGANEFCDRALLALLADDASTPERRSAVLSGLGGRELESLNALLGPGLANDAAPAALTQDGDRESRSAGPRESPGSGLRESPGSGLRESPGSGERVPLRERWREPAQGRDVFVRLLARCVAREGVDERRAELLALGSNADVVDWQREALCAGLLEARVPGPDGKPAPLRLTRAPAGELPAPLRGAVTWPGHPAWGADSPTPLDDDELASFARGRDLYRTTCAACHQPSGRGEPGKAPPLRHSAWVLGEPERLARILDKGFAGAIEREGRVWDLEMPAYVAPDEEIAAVLTYIRREWGHGAEPVDAATVGRVRATYAEHPHPWTAEELASMTKNDTDPAIATFGAGCFWCVEAVLEQVDGVVGVQSGYMGGTVDDPTYRQICTGDTGHAEVVQVTFDPEVLPYEALLEWFWRLHDPTTLNRQGADVGTQYRSAIFYHSEEQRAAAEASKDNASPQFDDPIVTEITPAATFWSAEEYHQDYYRANKTAGYCRMVIAPKLDKLGLEK